MLVVAEKKTKNKIKRKTSLVAENGCCPQWLINIDKAEMKLGKLYFKCDGLLTQSVGRLSSNLDVRDSMGERRFLIHHPYSNIRQIEEMILTFDGQSQRLSHMCS